MAHLTEHIFYLKDISLAPYMLSRFSYDWVGYVISQTSQMGTTVGKRELVNGSNKSPGLFLTQTASKIILFRIVICMLLKYSFYNHIYHLLLNKTRKCFRSTQPRKYKKMPASCIYYNDMTINIKKASKEFV